MLTVDNVLDEKVQVNGYGDEITVLEYMGRIALQVWIEDEGFSGKRPFGDSGWAYGDVCWPIAERHGITEPDEVYHLIKEALEKRFAGK